MLKRIILVLSFVLVVGTVLAQDSLSVCFAGDLLLDRGVRQRIERSSVEALFAESKPFFQQSDFAVVNLECPVTNIVAPINKKYIFRAEPQWLPVLRKCGITHAALANNHSMDQGRRGLTDTYRNLLANDIVPIGYGAKTSEAGKPVFLEKNVLRVAVFNTVRVPLENWVYLENEPGICQLSAQKLATDIQKLKRQEPQTYIVVVLHWGVEFHKTCTSYQRKEAHELIDAGADAVIGHHPHVIENQEMYKGKPIFYSLGNFVFDQSAPDSRVGLLVRLTFEKKRVSYKSYKIATNTK